MLLYLLLEPKLNAGALGEELGPAASGECAPGPGVLKDFKSSGRLHITVTWWERFIGKVRCGIYTHLVK